MSALRIFVAGDHEIIRRVITAFLAFHPDWEICGEAVNGHADRAEQSLPQGHCSDHHTEQTVREVFRSGALGFVLKPNATHDLAPAMETVQRGQTFFTARFAEMTLKVI